MWVSQSSGGSHKSTQPDFCADLSHVHRPRAGWGAAAARSCSSCAYDTSSACPVRRHEAAAGKVLKQFNGYVLGGASAKLALASSVVP